MLPGFVDAHGHVFMGGLQALSANLLAPPDGEVNEIALLQQTLRDWAAANAEAVERYDLIIGFGYDNAQLAELRHPTRDDLDAVSSDVPIVIIHQSGHLAALNSAALEVVGYDAATEDPEGGVIRRRAGSREPDGVLEETAFFAAIVKLHGRYRRGRGARLRGGRIRALGQVRLHHGRGGPVAALDRGDAAEDRRRGRFRRSTS